MKIYKTLPDGIQIVEYEQSLAPAIADMWNKSGEGWGGQYGSGVWTTEHVIAQQAASAFFNIYIAMDGNIAVGYCSLSRYYKDENTAYVHLLNVRPDYYGRRIGKELVLMCVNKTIALGMPRIDIHTWPGNTKAMPLYKKCGFQWEDRSDTTLLSNFIPTVLATELFRGFFEKADWYSDSTRKIKTKPDGKKRDKFEFYEYKWEKDGQNLRVGFEKSGRRIRLIETDDYKIELTAENHELAFGLDYCCRFDVINKTGSALDVSINAKNDGVIRFEGSWVEAVTDKATFEGIFHVDAITCEQDKMRMHPCVLADVRVGGKHVEFGLGIEPKFPIEVELIHKRQFAEPGNTEDVYINIKSNLSQDSTVGFVLPDNQLLNFEQSEFEMELAERKQNSLKTQALVVKCGYSAVPVTYKIALANGKAISVTRPLHLVNQGLTGSFAFETNKHFGAANGLWRLRLNKHDNEVNFDRLIESGHCEFSISRLGEPYDDEFNIMEPADVRVEQNGALIRFEADYESGKFKGALLTEIYEFDAAGTIKRRHRVSNIGKKPLNLSMQTEFWTSVGRRAVLHYDGDFHRVADDMVFGFDSIVYEKIDENWVFDMNPENPAGIYWPKQYKPTIEWGDLLKFTCPIGELQPGQSFETETFAFMCGVFKDYHAFRNYVVGVYSEKVPFARNHLECIANAGNPVLSQGTLSLTVGNNRLKTWEGIITVLSPDELFTGVLQEDLDDELRPETTLIASVAADKSGICSARFSLDLSGFEKDVERTLLVTDNTEIISKERSGVFTIENNELSYSLAPGNSDAVYSMKYGKNEWMFSRYPSLEPYAWLNPFVGGLRSFPENMDTNVLREDITACFTSETDTYGNKWTGIRADVTVEKFEEYKGMRYSQYYLTLPGVPVLCHYLRLHNESGRYVEPEIYSLLFMSGKEDLEDTVAEMTTDEKTKYRLCFTGDGHEMHYDRLISFSREGESHRPEKLYVYKEPLGDKCKSSLEYDIDFAYCEFDMQGSIPSGSHFTTKPLFCLLTEKTLTLESLKDLSKIEFK